MKVAAGIATPILPLARGAGRSSGSAPLLIGNEWDGFGLDFLDNSYATRVSSDAETLLGSGPSTAEIALGLDFTDNSSAVRN